MSPKLVVFGGLAVLAAVMVGVARITGGNGAKAHPLGTEVVVGHIDHSTGVRTRIGLTVLAVRTGTPQELEAAGFQLDSDEKEAMPYYIDARFANTGQGAVKRSLRLGLEDSHRNLVRSPLILRFGDQPFEQCPETDQRMLKPGESYEACTLVLVPKGVDVGKVSYLSDNGPGKEPEFVYWATK